MHVCVYSGWVREIIDAGAKARVAQKDTKDTKRKKRKKRKK